MTLKVKIHIKALITAAAFYLSNPALVQAETRYLPADAYAQQLGGLTVSFLARDLETGDDFILEGSDLDTREAPWSTFKIPNLMIALETGVAPSLDEWREWDADRRPAAAHWPDAWKEGQTLGEAFSRSSVWYFQDLALEIGGAVYRERLGAWGYGNADVPDGSDNFWLGASLQISVREQVDFLEGLLTGQLGVSDDTLVSLDAASKAGQASGVSLHGKTGSGPDDPANIDGTFSGWYVGYLRREARAPVVFALHVAAPSFSALRDFRREFSVRLLEDAGLASPGMLAAN
jgi:beta-lactamase class D